MVAPRPPPQRQAHISLDTVLHVLYEANGEPMQLSNLHNIQFNARVDHITKEPELYMRIDVGTIRSLHAVGGTSWELSGVCFSINVQQIFN